MFSIGKTNGDAVTLLVKKSDFSKNKFMFLEKQRSNHFS